MVSGPANEGSVDAREELAELERAVIGLIEMIKGDETLAAEGFGYVAFRRASATG